jgi:hypothetical protein
MLYVPGFRPLRAVFLLGLTTALLGLPVLSDVTQAATRSRGKSVRTTQKKSTRTTVRRASSRSTVRKARPGRTRYSASKSRQRRLAMARARQAAYARQLRDIQTPQFKAGADGQLVPDVRATAAIIYNPATHQVLY